MKKSLSTLVVCGTLAVFGTSAAMAQPQPQQHRDDHHMQSNDHRNGMYESGHRDGWYKRGGHVPQQYRGSSYVVTDWRTRRLPPPRRGYHYVRSDNGDLLLVAITSGVIASIIAQH
jgi:Ni/Co efflux regulator RcnB